MDTGVSLGLFGSKVNSGIFFSGVVSTDFDCNFFSQGMKDHIESNDLSKRLVADGGLYNDEKRFCNFAHHSSSFNNSVQHFFQRSICLGGSASLIF